MTQQKLEDRVVLEGGVILVELVGSSSGGQGKAIPVDQTAVQLELPIATAEHHAGSRTGPGMGRVVVPKGDRQCRNRYRGDDGGGCQAVDDRVVEGGLEQGTMRCGRPVYVDRTLPTGLVAIPEPRRMRRPADV